MGASDTVSPLDAPLAPSPLDVAYSERARLVAFLARVYPSHWAVDPESPDWPVICVHSPAGQMCWHIGPADVGLFPARLETRASDWDGHSTAEKYERLARLGLSEDVPRRFQLDRDVDVSGVSGTGIVADGVVWPDGSADVRWRGPRPSAVHWDRAEHAEQIHGHGGATRLVFLD